MVRLVELWLQGWMVLFRYVFFCFLVSVFLTTVFLLAIAVAALAEVELEGTAAGILVLAYVISAPLAYRGASGITGYFRSEPTSTLPSLVTVWAGDAGHAGLLQGMLVEEGIPAQVSDEHLGTIAVRVNVPAEHLVRAEEIAGEMETTTADPYQWKDAPPESL